MPCTTSDYETEQVLFLQPRARTGLVSKELYTKMQPKTNLLQEMIQRKL